MRTAEPIHPGEHLAEILKELDINPHRLAKAIGVHPTRIYNIVHCRRPITEGVALRIGQALGMPPDFWLNLQRMHDWDVARAKLDVAQAKIDISRIKLLVQTKSLVQDRTTEILVAMSDRVDRVDSPSKRS